MKGRDDNDRRGLSRYLLLSLLVNLLILMWVTRIGVPEGEPFTPRREPTVLLSIYADPETEPQRLTTVRQLVGEMTEPIVVDDEYLKTEAEEQVPDVQPSGPSPAVETFDFRYDYDSPPVVVQPVILGGRRDPVMPESLSSSRWEGEVTLGLLINDRGELVDLWVEESSGREDADRDALACYRETRWQPATVNGRPTVCRLFVKVPYRQAYKQAGF
jgi:TonB family protein